MFCQIEHCYFLMWAARSHRRSRNRNAVINIKNMYTDMARLRRMERLCIAWPPARSPDAHSNRIEYPPNWLLAITTHRKRKIYLRIFLCVAPVSATIGRLSISHVYVLQQFAAIRLVATKRILFLNLFVFFFLLLNYFKYKKRIQ